MAGGEPIKAMAIMSEYLSKLGGARSPVSLTWKVK